MIAIYPGMQGTGTYSIPMTVTVREETSSTCGWVTVASNEPWPKDEIRWALPEMRWALPEDLDAWGRWLRKREMSLRGHQAQEELHSRPCRYDSPLRRAQRAQRPTRRSSSTGVRNFRAK
jgi:hypothetical protein